MRTVNDSIDASAIDGIAEELEHIDDDGIRSEEVVSDVEKEAVTEESTPDAEAAKANEDQADEEVTTPLETPTDEAASKKDDEPVLPEAYVRAAIHQGWKLEDIEADFKSNPEQMERTLRNIYESTNTLSKQFADLGRASKVTPDAKPDESGSKKRFEHKRMDIEALIKDDPDNPLIALVKGLDNGLANTTDALNDMYEKQNMSGADVESARARAKGDRATESIIDTFFQNDRMTGYEALYGKVPNVDDQWAEVLTGAQFTKRQEVITAAEQIMAGARVQGKDMDVAKVLDLAHMMVSSDFQEQVIRSKIKTSVSKRAGSLSIKPSDGKNKVKPEGAASSRKDLEASVAEKLAALGN